MALNKQNQKALIERMKALPEDLQQLLVSGEFDYFIENTAQEHKLEEEQKNVLTNELLLIFLAFEIVDDLVDNLVSQVGIEKITAEKIVNELTNSPLRPLVLFSQEISNDLKVEQSQQNKVLMEKYNIPVDKAESFDSTLSKVISGTNKIADLPRLLQKEVGIDPENARKLTAELIDAWGPIVAREEAEAKAKKDEVASLADKIAAIRPATPAEEDTQKETLEPAKLVRTMDADMAKHGYGAMTHSPRGNEVNLDTDTSVIKATPQDQLRPFKSE